MAERKGNGGQPTAEAAAAALPKVQWDDQNMKSSYANVCNVSSTREEVILLFGVNQAWKAPAAEVTVQLTDRIILSPFAAKRLSVLLQNVIGQYEQRFGTLEITATQPQRKPEATS
jgi:hypothetical protein